MTKSNMYSLSAGNFNPWVGCSYDCTYCKSSFQSQLKRFTKCPDCQTYKPHAHPERLERPLPRTKYMQFIFTCSSGDIFFCPTDYLEKIVDRIKRDKDKTFLIQSKNPKTFERVKWPDNVILGTTIETNFPTPRVSRAPSPAERCRAFRSIKHRHKMVTIEPVMNFDLTMMIDRIELINPCMIWLGFDSKHNHLAEPTIGKFRELHWELSNLGFVVILKTVKG